MSARITRAALQVVYLERAAAPSPPGTTAELLGYSKVRADGAEVARQRPTLDLRGRVELEDVAPRTTRVHLGVDKVLAVTISAHTNSLTHASLSGATIVLADVTGAYELRGVDSWCDEQVKLLVNKGAGSLTLKHEHANAILDDRFALTNAADVVLGTGSAAWLIRDPESARWRVRAYSALGGPSLDFSDENNSQYVPLVFQ